MFKRLCLIIITVLFSTTITFSQKNRSKKLEVEKPDKICRDFFLKKRITHTKYYSDDIILPVTVYGDKYRLIIKSEFLHRYLTIEAAKTDIELKNDSLLLDSVAYLNKVLNIIKGKEKFDFNPSTFNSFVKEGKYTILDKANPYSKEIKQIGLNKFIKKRLIELGKRGDNISYRLIEKDDYARINEYNYIYLIEALFEYNFIYELGDGMEGFTKVGCPKTVH